MGAAAVLDIPAGSRTYGTRKGRARCDRLVLLYSPVVSSSWIVQFSLLLITFSLVVDLARSSPTSAATELLISTILPTASLVCINLDFSFCRKGLLRNHTSLPTLLELMKLTDTALRNFWSKEIHGLAPIIGKVGYLSGVSNKAEYVDVIADAIIGVAARTKNRELGRIVEEFEGSKGVRKRTWGVLLDALKVRKGGVGSRLKSLVETGERVIENLEDSLLFDEGTTGWGSDKGGGEGEDIFREEAETEEEDGLFAWSDWNAGEDDVDNIFIWADENEYQEEDEVSLFEDLEDPAVAIDYHGGKNILSLFEELEGLAKGIKDGGKEPLFMEDNELMLEETALPRSEGEGEGEDMIWI